MNMFSQGLCAYSSLMDTLIHFGGLCYSVGEGGLEIPAGGPVARLSCWTRPGLGSGGRRGRAGAAAGL